MKKNLTMTSLAIVPMLCQASGDAGVKGATVPSKPNVIFILADDLGYGDLGCYGQQTIRTPCLDRMAKEGMKFNDFYAGSTVSAPSRCVLMTGLHTGHCGVRMNAGPSKDAMLWKEDYTMAEMFKENGYVTGMYGKWGLGSKNSQGAPEKKGFDNFLGYLSQSKAHKYYPDSLVEIINGKSVDINIPEGTYSHDLFMKKTLEFIRNNKDNPFFLYLPFTIPHAVMEIPNEDLKYVDEDGNSIFEETPFAGKANYVPQDKPKAVYASMVTKLDKDVGRILDELAELGLEENTLVIFTSDNGPHMEGGIHYEDFDSNGPFSGFKRSLHEGGIREPFIARWPSVIPAGTETDKPYVLYDMFPTMCRLVGVSVPQGLDGIDLMSALMGGAEYEKDRMLYWEISQKGIYMQAVRWGKWKMIRSVTAETDPDIELYDLSKDISESTSVARTNPEVVSRLAAFMKKNSKPARPAFDWQGKFIK